MRRSMLRRLGLNGEDDKKEKTGSKVFFYVSRRTKTMKMKSPPVFQFPLMFKELGKSQGEEKGAMKKRGRTRSGRKENKWVI